MNLLENELVKKYFGEGNCYWLSGKCGIASSDTHNPCVACRILAAMQEPIQKGERCLVLPADMDVYEEIEESGLYDNNAHTNRLNIPSRFQTPEKEPHCIVKCMEDRKHDCAYWHKTTPDPVEEKIKEIRDRFPEDPGMIGRLLDLVAIARSTKEK